MVTCVKVYKCLESWCRTKHLLSPFLCMSKSCKYYFACLACGSKDINITFSNCIIYFLRRRKHFFIVHNFKTVPTADTVKHAPFSVETVKMSCNVISSMDFVLMVIVLYQNMKHTSKYLEFNHVDIKFKWKEMIYLIFWPIWAKNIKKKKTSSMNYLLVHVSIFGVLPKPLL